MKVTVWTDASVKNGQLGYAFIAETGPGRYLRYTGGGADLFGDINATEAFAIDVAVGLVIKAWPQCTIIEVITDSQVVASTRSTGVGSIWVCQSVNDAIQSAGHRQLSINWLPRRSTERMREVDAMARSACKE